MNREKKKKKDFTRVGVGGGAVKGGVGVGGGSLFTIIWGGTC